MKNFTIIFKNVTLVVAFFLVTNANAQYTQDGPLLYGTGALTFSLQGYATAMSGDGNTVIVGGFYDNGIGAVWFYVQDSAGVWTQQGNKFVGSGYVGSTVYQGWSVAISADGNTAAIGGYADSGQIGAVWIAVRSNGVWTQQGSKLVGTGAVGTSTQGSSVSLSADGNTVVVGGPGD